MVFILAVKDVLSSYSLDSKGKFISICILTRSFSPHTLSNTVRGLMKKFDTLLNTLVRDPLYLVDTAKNFDLKKKEGDRRKNSYERPAYESVDDI